MIELIEGFEENIIGIRGSGKISRDDYLSVVVPATEAAFSEHETVRIFWQVMDDTTFEPGAIFEDALVGTKNYFGWEKIALVTDVAFLQNAVKIFRVLMPCPTKLFASDEFDAAKKWIKE